MAAVATTATVATAATAAAALAGRAIHDDGITAEAVWRRWLALRPPPAVSVAELLTHGQRLVVVAPHPDDEVLACGGLIAQQVLQGGAVAVVAVTDGEASHRGDALWPTRRLANTRRLERARGLGWLGVGAAAVSHLALPDGAVAGCSAALLQALRQLLRPTDVVLTTWRLDGHPDHDAVGSAAAQVCASLGCRLLEAPVWMWHWSAPDDPRVPWQRLRGLPLPQNAAALKASALAEHHTQLAPRGQRAPVLGPAICARAVRASEYFFVRATP